MKIELVCPAAEDSAFLRSRAMAILAARTPPDVGLALRDDILRRLDPRSDLDFSADLAAISVSTKTAARAYELAAAYRRHGVPVVLGGIHVTALPEEASQHCDAVVQGEAEGLWEQVVDDARRRDLRPLYRHEALPELTAGPLPRWDIFRPRPRRRGAARLLGRLGRQARYVPVTTLQASRGCPFDCEFCSVTPFYGRAFRSVPRSEVVREIESLDRRWVMFADDDILGRPSRARRLLAELAPLKLSWFGQASLSGLSDPRNVELLARSGCKALFVGFESVEARSLASCGKHHNRPRRYLQVVRDLQDHGIAVWASFVFGLDHDTPDIFARTLEFAREARLFMALFAMLTPYPGTRLYQRLEQEGRLLDHRWWLHPRPRDEPLHVPRSMTPDQLHRGWQWIWKEFYSGGSILGRFRAAAGSSLFSMAAFWPLNMLQRRLTRDKILGGDAFFRRDT